MRLFVTDCAGQLIAIEAQSNSYLSILLGWEPIIAPILLTALSVFTRMYRIGRSNIVTWDEAQ